jgi:hypothetical protein
MTTPAKRAPRKAAPRKQTPPGTGKPTPAKAIRGANPRVVLDLDALTKDKAFPDLKLPKVEFTFLLDGNPYELRDPRDSDWKMALQLANNPFLLMRQALVGADDPIEDPTADEIGACRERLGLGETPPPPNTEEAIHEAQLYPDGVTPVLLDRFTATYLPGWKLNALFQRWHEHYKIDLKDGKGILAALLGTNE